MSRAGIIGTRHIQTIVIMRKLKMIPAIVAIAVTCVSCGGSKSATSGTQWGAPKELKQEVDECISYAMQKPGIRAFGDGTSTNLSRAVSYAEAQARAKFAKALESAIKTAQSQEGVGYGKSSSDGNSGARVTDEGDMSNDMVMSIANGTVKNMAIVKTSQYMRADGAYHMYVCLEYRGDMSQLADDIARQVKQQVSDDDRLKMKYDFEKFRQRVEEELAKQKAQ